MDAPEARKLTALLRQWSDGDSAAQNELMPLVYQELRLIASRRRRRAGAGDTLRTTALVNEAYLRLVDIEGATWRDRVHFFAVSATLMRRILIDAARAESAAKRKGTARAADLGIDLDQIPAFAQERSEELLALDAALTRLTALDERRGKVVELRAYGGLSAEETAEALGVSVATVMRDWRVAKAWLLREVGRRAD